jgi:hypothetical protein
MTRPITLSSPKAGLAANATGYGLGMGGADILKAMCPFVASWGRRNKDWLAATAAAAVFVVVTGYSLSAGYGFAAQHRVFKQGERTTAIEQRGDTATLQVSGTFTVSLSTQTTTPSLYVSNSASIGVGTNNPSATVRMLMTGAMIYDRVGAATGAHLLLRKANGTTDAPTAVTSGQNLGQLSFQGFNGSAYTVSGGGLLGYASEDWSPSANGSYLILKTTPVGAAASAERLRIDSSGNVGVGLITPTATLQVSGMFTVRASSAPSSPILYVSSTGAVGIGTANPLTSFDVVGLGRLVDRESASGNSIVTVDTIRRGNSGGVGSAGIGARITLLQRRQPKVPTEMPVPLMDC